MCKDHKPTEMTLKFLTYYNTGTKTKKIYSNHFLYEYKLIFWKYMSPIDICLTCMTQLSKNKVMVGKLGDLNTPLPIPLLILNNNFIAAHQFSASYIHTKLY